MLVTVLGKKNFKKADKEFYILYLGREREEVIGQETMVAFTNEKTYSSFASADIGKEYDLAIFFENGYTKAYNKKKGD